MRTPLARLITPSALKNNSVGERQSFSSSSWSPWRRKWRISNIHSIPITVNSFPYRH